MFRTSTITILCASLSYSLNAAPIPDTRHVDPSTTHVHQHNRSHIAMTDTQQQAMLRQMMNNNVHKNDTGELHVLEQKRKQRILSTLLSNQTNNTATNLVGHNSVLKSDYWGGHVTKDKILAILIEFPDYPANRITPDETFNYFDDYSTEHYQNLLFGQQGYTGSNGKNMLSMVQFYQQQSGGSYTQYGQVAGWYTAQYPAAYYGAQDGYITDINVRALVREALLAAQADPNINLGDYDLEDRYDIDNDGDLREPDGLIDHIMIFHSGPGQEAGGGRIGTDAIWSHRWNLGDVFQLVDYPTSISQWGGVLAAYDYTIQPIDAGTGVTVHEYGHDLGLPDEYDLAAEADEFGYTPGEPISYWSAMASGSWAGEIPGTEPTAFSPWAREFLQNSLGGNWFNVLPINIKNLNTETLRVQLTHAANRSDKYDALKIQLPPKEVKVVDPFEQFAYYSGKANNLNVLATFGVDLTNASAANLEFMVHYNIEQDFDYGRILVNGIPIKGNITTDKDPYGLQHGHGFTGNSGGWQSAHFDLTAFIGGFVEISFNYLTDQYTVEDGFWFDNVTVNVDNEPVIHFNAEQEEHDLSLSGITRHSGSFDYNHYYLVEWRQHKGVDQGLAHINHGGTLFSFDPGMVVWYVDTSFTSNNSAAHPGEGWLGVVDGDRNPQVWSSNVPASSAYQLRDAAFNTKTGSILSIVDWFGDELYDPYIVANPMFIDWQDYSNPIRPATGKKIPQYGLLLNVLEQSKDGTDVTIGLTKQW
ncbi:immune inhibitor A domain-containing protein [Vibrio variabilis]|uniref:immune inhibitor A domain-containing protein n=1 Tax=Vibrio variabilis TaxID=990271 RepID=UPI000DD647C3|nr:immune inhibitor A domain-containing protein [Vibrio variabilis]